MPTTDSTAEWHLRTPAERAEEIALAERQFQRALRRRWVLLVGGCFGCVLFGDGLMAFALHSTDAQLAPVFWWCGGLIGYGGVMLILLHHVQRAEDF